jgi:hypothetical protein
VQAAIAVALLLSAAPGAAAGPVPEWTKPQVLNLLSQAAMAGQAPDAATQDAQLAGTAGMAYGLERRVGESNDGFARRILKRREPGHPTVKNGQWLLALARRLYADLGARADKLGRFERDRRDRLALTEGAKMALGAAEQIAGLLEIRIDSIDAYVAPLPVAAGEPPIDVGAVALAQGEKLAVEGLDRLTLVDDRPKPDAERTPGGALRELFASLKQFDIGAQMFGRIDKKKKAGVGQVRVFFPASKPALLLNELARAAKEAGSHTMYVMVFAPGTGKLGQIRLALDAKARRGKPRKGKKATELVRARCRDDETMQPCVDRLVELAATGPLRYDVD